MVNLGRLCLGLPPSTVTELNFLNVAFGTTQLHFDEWLLLAALSTGPLLVHELIVFILTIKNKLAKTS